MGLHNRRAGAALVVTVLLAAAAGCASSPQYVALALQPAPQPAKACAAPHGLKAFALRSVAVAPFANSDQSLQRTWIAPDGQAFPVYEYPVKADGVYITELIESALGRKAPFALVDRSRTKDVLAELSLQSTAVADPATAARIGKLAGADAIIMGTVTRCRSELMSSVNGRSFLCTPIPQAAFSLKMIHVETGQVLFTCQTGASSLNYLERPCEFRSDELIKTNFQPLNDALHGLPGRDRLDYVARQLVNEVADELAAAARK